LLVLEGNFPTEDGGDGLGGVLVDRVSALATVLFLAIIGVIILPARPLPVFFTESLVQALALPHGMFGAFMNRTWTIHELGIVGAIGALSTRSVDGVDSTIRPEAAVLSTSGAF